MVEERVQRKLTTILAADVEGYSRLMSADEEATLKTFKTYREIIDSLIAGQNGRLVGTAGDSMLVEFGSTVEAVRCAMSIQEDLKVRNAELAEDRRIRFRIGINVGDVMVEGDDLFGDGVNVAARLEGLAEPGGICISGSAFDQVKNKLSIGFEDIGPQQVKNIAEPVPAFRVVPGPVSVVAGGTPTVAKRWRMPAIAAAVVVVLGAGGVAWWQPWAPDVDVASIDRMAFPLPDKPSIAVLPFANLSGDKEQEYFADGITDDLITDLSKIPGLFVIARNSVFTYKGKPVLVRQVAEELGVRYVLEGSVRRVGNQVRINAQLIDATTGGHLWADRYDGSLNDVFGLQDMVLREVVAALAVKLTSMEQAEEVQPETDSAEAYDAFLRGWSHYRRRTPDDYAKAIPYFEKAIDLDPNYSRAYAALAAIYWAVTDKKNATNASDLWTRLGVSPVEALRREQRYLQEAMINPVVLAYRVASGRLSRQGQHEAAIGEASRAFSLDPNDPVAHEAMATALVYAGKPAEAAKWIRQAMRLDPQLAHEYLFWLGLAQFGMERYEDAAETLTRATQSIPDDDRSLIVLAAIYGHLGRAQDAKSAVDKANGLRRERQERLSDADTQERLRAAGIELGLNTPLVGPYTQKDVDMWPFKEEADRARLRQGLQLAGLPEEGEEESASPAEVAGATTVDPAAAKKLFDRGVPFVDVRTDASWKDGHVRGAINLTFKSGAFNEAALSKVAAKDQEVVIYCAGPRCLLSSMACAKAVGWGYEKVYYLRDGWPGWKAAGYPVAVQ